jgi:hypothetical protein
VVLGTWCEDSQNLLPKFIKVLEDCNYNTTSLNLLGVDRKKQALNVEHLLMNIEKVPTIFIYKGPRVIATIIESIDKENIETELLYWITRDKELGN